VQAIKNGILVKQGKVESKSVVLRPVLTITETEINMILKGVKEALKGIE
jgi:4-aminobutyrate aminotransferase-like enzyme